MAVKEILLHVDNLKPCAARLELAIRLARSHQARLTGIFIVERHFFSQRGTKTEDDRVQARELFFEGVTRSGIEHQWLDADSEQTGLGMAETLNLQAYFSDLLIVGQHDSSTSSHIPADLPERTVLGSGRPVLVVPYACAMETVGERVLLAWRGGPESARAVSDALPFLEQARAVRAISVPPSGEEEKAPVHGDLGSYLARHGIQAELEKPAQTGLSIGDILLNRAADEGIDLLVLGTFSQARRGMVGLGDVGRHLLKYMTIPVLMSH